MTSLMSRAEAISLGRIDPAAESYGMHQRDPDAIRREAARVRMLMEACRRPASIPVLVTTPADDVAAAEAAFDRRAARQGFSL